MRFRPCRIDYSQRATESVLHEKQNRTYEPISHDTEGLGGDAVSTEMEEPSAQDALVLVSVLSNSNINASLRPVVVKPYLESFVGKCTSDIFVFNSNLINQSVAQHDCQEAQDDLFECLFKKEEDQANDQFYKTEIDRLVPPKFELSHPIDLPSTSGSTTTSSEKNSSKCMKSLHYFIGGLDALVAEKKKEDTSSLLLFQSYIQDEVFTLKPPFNYYSRIINEGVFKEKLKPYLTWLEDRKETWEFLKILRKSNAAVQQCRNYFDQNNNHREPVFFRMDATLPPVNSSSSSHNQEELNTKRTFCRSSLERSALSYTDICSCLFGVKTKAIIKEITKCSTKENNSNADIVSTVPSAYFHSLCYDKKNAFLDSKAKHFEQSTAYDLLPKRLYHTYNLPDRSYSDRNEEDELEFDLFMPTEKDLLWATSEFTNKASKVKIDFGDNCKLFDPWKKVNPSILKGSFISHCSIEKETKPLKRAQKSSQLVCLSKSTVNFLREICEEVKGIQSHTEKIPEVYGYAINSWDSSFPIHRDEDPARYVQVVIDRMRNQGLHKSRYSFSMDQLLLGCRMIREKAKCVYRGFISNEVVEPAAFQGRYMKKILFERKYSDQLEVSAHISHSLLPIHTNQNSINCDPGTLSVSLVVLNYFRYRILSFIEDKALSQVDRSELLTNKLLQNRRSLTNKSSSSKKNKSTKRFYKWIKKLRRNKILKDCLLFIPKDCATSATDKNLGMNQMIGESLGEESEGIRRELSHLVTRAGDIMKEETLLLEEMKVIGGQQHRGKTPLIFSPLMPRTHDADLNRTVKLDISKNKNIQQDEKASLKHEESQIPSGVKRRQNEIHHSEKKQRNCCTSSVNFTSDGMVAEEEVNVSTKSKPGNLNVVTNHPQCVEKRPSNLVSPISPGSPVINMTDDETNEAEVVARQPNLISEIPPKQFVDHEQNSNDESQTNPIDQLLKGNPYKNEAVGMMSNFFSLNSKSASVKEGIKREIKITEQATAKAVEMESHRQSSSSCQSPISNIVEPKEEIIKNSSYLCSENFLENYSDVIAALALGYKEPSPSETHITKRKMIPVDCPLLDFVGVDIEVLGQKAVLIQRLGSWYNNDVYNDNEKTGFQGAKDVARKVVLLAASGKYKAIALFLNVDIMVTPSVSDDIKLLQNAFAQQNSQNGCPCGNISIQFTHQSTISKSIFRMVYDGGENDVDWLQEIAADAQCQERSRFLLSICSSLTVFASFFIIKEFSRRSGSMDEGFRALLEFLSKPIEETKDSISRQQLIENTPEMNLVAIKQLTLAMKIKVTNRT